MLVNSCCWGFDKGVEWGEGKPGGGKPSRTERPQVTCLVCKRGDLIHTPSLHFKIAGTALHACSLGTVEMEAGGFLGLPGQPAYPIW